MSDALSSCGFGILADGKRRGIWHGYARPGTPSLCHIAQRAKPSEGSRVASCLVLERLPCPTGLRTGQVAEHEVGCLGQREVPVSMQGSRSVRARRELASSELASLAGEGLGTAAEDGRDLAELDQTGD